MGLSVVVTRLRNCPVCTSAPCPSATIQSNPPAAPGGRRSSLSTDRVQVLEDAGDEGRRAEAAECGPRPSRRGDGPHLPDEGTVEMAPRGRGGGARPRRLQPHQQARGNGLLLRHADQQHAGYAGSPRPRHHGRHGTAPCLWQRLAARAVRVHGIDAHARRRDYLLLDALLGGQVGGGGGTRPQRVPRVRQPDS